MGRQTLKAWLIHFDDTDMKPEIFVGDGGGKAARKRLQELSQSWAVTLFFSDAVVDEAMDLAIEATEALMELRAKCEG